MITLERVLSVFNITLESRPGVYSSPTGQVLYYPLERPSVYSCMTWTKLKTILPQRRMVKEKLSYKSPLAVLPLDKIQIRFIPTVCTNISLFNSCRRNVNFPVYDSKYIFQPTFLNNIYESYEECLQYCIRFNDLYSAAKRTDIRSWLIVAKSTITANEKTVTMLKKYVNSLNNEVIFYGIV